MRNLQIKGMLHYKFNLAIDLRCNSEFQTHLVTVKNDKYRNSEEIVFTSNLLIFDLPYNIPSLKLLSLPNFSFADNIL